MISNTTVWIAGILAGLDTLFLTIGGVRYLMAGGDPAEVEKAKTAFKSAGIGYALALLAPDPSAPTFLPRRDGHMLSRSVPVP